MALPIFSGPWPIREGCRHIWGVYITYRHNIHLVITIAVLALLVSGSLITIYQTNYASDTEDVDTWDCRIAVDGTTATAVYPDGRGSNETSSNVSGFINSVLWNVTEKGKEKAIVLIEGKGLLNAAIKVPSNIKLVFDATLTLADNTNKPMIWMDRVDSVEIVGGVLDGNRDNQAKDRSALSGILVRSSTNFSIRWSTLAGLGRVRPRAGGARRRPGPVRASPALGARYGPAAVTRSGAQQDPPDDR